MRNIFIGFIIITLTNCSIGKNRVFYDEMGLKPIVKIYENKIELLTENSKINSALSIYEIDFTIDTLAKKVFIVGYQSVNKTSQNKFEISDMRFQKSEISRYSFYWIDPNKNQSEIEKIFSL